MSEKGTPTSSGCPVASSQNLTTAWWVTTLGIDGHAIPNNLKKVAAKVGVKDERKN